MPSYKRRINAGIKLLNQRFDWDWPNVIDLDILDVSSYTLCPLAQLGFHIVDNTEGFFFLPEKRPRRYICFVSENKPWGFRHIDFPNRTHDPYSVFGAGKLQKVYLDAFGPRIADFVEFGFQIPKEYGYKAYERNAEAKRRVYEREFRTLYLQWKEKIQEITNA